MSDSELKTLIGISEIWVSGFQCGAIWHYTFIHNYTSLIGGNCNLLPDFVFETLATLSIRGLFNSRSI